MTPRSILTHRGKTACRTKDSVNDSIEADGRTAYQSALIYGYLASFPANIAAVETYDHFCRYAQSLPSGLRSKRYQGLQRLLRNAARALDWCS